VDEAIQRVVTGGTEYAAQYRVVRPDQTTCWIDAHGVIVREGLTRMLGIGIDITPQKRTEQSLQEAKIELARVSRIVTVGELTASIAHEINQPITAIVTNGSACLRWLALQPPNLDQAREAAAAAIRDANRAGEVIRGMRELLLNRVSPDLALVDLNEAIREVMALSGSELMIAGVAAQAELSSPLPLVIGNQIQLQQVILNLFTNAIDAMSNITDERKLVIRSTKSRTNVLIEVEDTGTGIDPQQADHIFEPFFTNKPQSLGIGLSVSRSIVEAHGGRLWATPGKSRGSILHFTLPIADSSGG
jgi:C4-dicarboxylate-specific signal transduction histidine kinase